MIVRCVADVRDEVRAHRKMSMSDELTKSSLFSNLFQVFQDNYSHSFFFFTAVRLIEF